MYRITQIEAIPFLTALLHSSKLLYNVEKIFVFC